MRRIIGALIEPTEQARMPDEETPIESDAQQPEAQEPDATSQADPASDAQDLPEAEAAAAVEAAMAEAVADEDAPGGPTSFPLPALGAMGPGELSGSLNMLADVNLHVQIELGRTRMLVEDVLRLNEGAVIELDKLAGDPVDIYVNGRPVARGEVLVLNDNFCVRISEILDQVSQNAG
ncbi:MAG: flagellar motor switch protein FliN [Phycisphaerales bacterium]